MYAGLKFSSLAMRIAGDVMTSVKDDASRMLKEMEQEAAAKRARRAAEAAFLQLLKDHTPSELQAAAGGSPSAASGGTRSSGKQPAALLVDINGDTTYEDAKIALQEHADWKAVSSGRRRRELFAAYSAALQQVVVQRRAKAEEQLVQLLGKLNVGPESDWSEVEPVLSSHPACGVIPADRRAELFDERIREAGSTALPKLLSWWMGGGEVGAGGRLGLRGWGNRDVCGDLALPRGG
eukprot:gene3694-3954_t